MDLGREVLEALRSIGFEKDRAADAQDESWTTGGIGFRQHDMNEDVQRAGAARHRVSNDLGSEEGELEA